MNTSLHFGSFLLRQPGPNRSGYAWPNPKGYICIKGFENRNPEGQGDIFVSDFFGATPLSRNNAEIAQLSCDLDKLNVKSPLALRRTLLRAIRHAPLQDEFRQVMLKDMRPLRKTYLEVQLRDSAQDKLSQKGFRPSYFFRFEDGQWIDRSEQFYDGDSKLKAPWYRKTLKELEQALRQSQVFRRGVELNFYAPEPQKTTAFA